jgi:virulence-associated protein VagC
MTAATQTLGKINKIHRNKRVKEQGIKELRKDIRQQEQRYIITTPKQRQTNFCELLNRAVDTDKSENRTAG